MFLQILAAPNNHHAVLSVQAVLGAAIRTDLMRVLIVTSLFAQGTGHAIGWLVPVLIMGLLFARVFARRR